MSKATRSGPVVSAAALLVPVSTPTGASEATGGTGRPHPAKPGHHRSTDPRPRVPGAFPGEGAAHVLDGNHVAGPARGTPRRPLTLAAGRHRTPAPGNGKRTRT